MDKRTKIILFIISIVVSIGTILISYYGIGRYLKLHRGGDTCTGYKKYSSLDKASTNRVVISFGPNQDQLRKMGPTIRSLIDQTVRVESVSINVPYSYDYPQEFEKIATIFRTGRDYGKSSNIIPTILRENDKNTIIIFLEPNIVYGIDFIENIITETVKNPGKAIIVEGKALCIQSADQLDMEKVERQDPGFILSETISIPSSETYPALF
jgi:hypothetical protein